MIHQDIIDRANDKYPKTSKTSGINSFQRVAAIEAATFEREQGNLFAEWVSQSGHIYNQWLGHWYGNGVKATTDELRQIFNERHKTTTP